jgi:hypothetical protein
MTEVETLILLTVSFRITSNVHPSKCFVIVRLKSIFIVQFLGITLIYHVQNSVFLAVINKFEIVYLPYFHLLCIT